MCSEITFLRFPGEAYVRYRKSNLTVILALYNIPVLCESEKGLQSYPQTYQFSVFTPEQNVQTMEKQYLDHMCLKNLQSPLVHFLGVDQERTFYLFSLVR